MRHGVRRGVQYFWSAASDLREVLRSRWTLAVEGAGALIGVAILVPSLAEITLFTVIGAAVTIVGAVAWAIDYRKLATGIVFQEASHEPGTLYAPPYDQWERLSIGARQGIYSHVVNERLADESLPIAFQIDHEAWLPHEGAAKSARIQVLARLQLNEGKIRLSSNLTHSPVLLGRTDYASFVVTNRLAYEEITSAESMGGELKFNDFDEHGRIRALEYSHSSNHIGGDLLLVAPDCFLVQVQSKGNGIYPNHWGPSASGSFDYPTDTLGAKDFRDIVKAGMLRELREEAGILGPSMPPAEDCRIIGFARANYLGGKPQFFGVAKTREIKPRILPAEYVASHKLVYFTPDASGSTLVSALQRFLATHSLIMPSLFMLADFVERWIATDAKRAQWLIQ